MRIICATLRHATAFLLAANLLATVQPLEAQVVTTGRLVGMLADSSGTAIPAAVLTLTRDGRVIRISNGKLSGEFMINGLAPGGYELLVEQAGYQPVRITGIPVAAGFDTRLKVETERRPPPITQVIERRYQGSGPGVPGVLVLGKALESSARSRPATDLARNYTPIIGDFSGSTGLGLGAGGLGPEASQLLVDGIEESLLRHPGIPAETGSAPIFARDGVAQVGIFGFAQDAGVATTTGETISLVSELGANQRFFRPWLAVSGLGFASAEADNPADSSSRSIQGGIAIGGPIKGDSASWFARLDYQDLERPTASPFGELGSELLDQLEAAAAPSNIAAGTRPLVRRWSGATGQAGFAFRPTDKLRITARLGAASWSEDAPAVATSVVNGAGSTLDARDLSFGAGLDYTSEIVTSATMIGVRTSSRDWSAGSLPFTSLGREGLAFGADPALQGEFDESMLQIAQHFSFPLGSHEVRAGGMAGRRAFTYDYLPGQTGRSEYGSADDFAAGRGAFYRSSAGSPADEVSLVEYAVFGDLVLNLTPRLSATVGLRYHVERIPLDLVEPSLEFGETFGLFNNLVPTNKSSSLGPRASLTFHPGHAERTMISIGGGLVPGRWDRSALAEVARFDGDVSVARGLGSFGWPTQEGLSSAAAYGFFGEGVRAPRSFVLDGVIRHSLPGGTLLALSGGYRHTDYLLRRADINRPAVALATSSDMRPIWGELEQVGELIAPKPGSNARFDDFDRVYGLTSTGYADNYEATVSLSGDLTAGLTVGAAYTYSTSKDNMVGARSAAVADRLSPLVGSDLAADWDAGRSDFDVPHRLVASVNWRSPGGALGFGARFRIRSGLPFTAGFPRGTDVNGDGSSGNDPVALAAVPGLSQLLGDAGCTAGTSAFAERNGCREATAKALDLQASIRLPFGDPGVRLTIDAFNLASSEIGLVDRAAVLVDPDGTITTDAQGRSVLPLVLNENFGRLLVRRNDPRTIRIGLRVEN